MPEFERYEGESEEEFAERVSLNRGKAMQDRFKVEEESVRLDTPKPFYDTAPVKDPNELESPEMEAPEVESPELEKPVTESFADFEEDEEPRKPRQIDPEATKRFYEEHTTPVNKEMNFDPQILDEEGSAMDYFLGPDPKKTDYYKMMKKRNFR